MASVGERQPLVSKDQFNNAEVTITNKATTVLRNIAITALGVAVIAAIVIVASHGGHAGTAIPSDIGVGAGSAAVGAGVVWGALKLFRDRPEKKRVEQDWKAKNKDTYKADVAGLREDGLKLTQKITLNGKPYNLEVIKGGGKAKITSQQGK